MKDKVERLQQLLLYIKEIQDDAKLQVTEYMNSDAKSIDKVKFTEWLEDNNIKGYV